MCGLARPIALRLVHRIKWSRREELNTPSAAYDATILALNYTGKILNPECFYRTYASAFDSTCPALSVRRILYSRL